MPLDIFLVERGRDLPEEPFATLEADEGRYIPSGSTEFICIQCLPRDIGGIAMAIEKDDILSASSQGEEIDLPELDDLVYGDEIQPEGFRVGWRVYKNRTRRIPVIGETGAEDLVLRHRL